MVLKELTKKIKSVCNSQKIRKVCSLLGNKLWLVFIRVSFDGGVSRLIRFCSGDWVQIDPPERLSCEDKVEDLAYLQHCLYLR